ncbi:MAG: hypothetical protein CSA10_00140 [Cardiobacteriales bacterium]|nr:MAG: hypothetical protein CSA10_00140 [Cardiobacteriales bacterium]
MIKNKYYLEKYIKINNTEVKHILIDNKELKAELKINWLPNAIYCDYYTHLKLCNFRKSL